MLEGRSFSVLNCCSESKSETENLLSSAGATISNDFANSEYVVISGLVNCDIQEFIRIRSNTKQVKWKGRDWVRSFRVKLSGQCTNGNFMWEHDKNALLLEGITVYVDAKATAKHRLLPILANNGATVVNSIRDGQSVVLSHPKSRVHQFAPATARRIRKSASLVVNSKWVDDCVKENVLVPIADHCLQLETSIGFHRPHQCTEMSYSLVHLVPEKRTKLRLQLASFGAHEDNNSPDLIVTYAIVRNLPVDLRMRTKYCLDAYLGDAEQRHDCCEFWHKPIAIIGECVSLQGKTFVLDLMNERGTAYISDIITYLGGSLTSHLTSSDREILITDRDAVRRPGRAIYKPTEFLRQLQQQHQQTGNGPHTEPALPAVGEACHRQRCGSSDEDQLTLCEIPTFHDDVSAVCNPTPLPQFLRSFVIYLRKKFSCIGGLEEALYKRGTWRPSSFVTPLCYSQMQHEINRGVVRYEYNGQLLIEGIFLAEDVDNARKYSARITEFVRDEVYVCVGVTNAVTVWRDKLTTSLLIYTPFRTVELFACRIDVRPFVSRPTVGLHFWIHRNVQDVLCRNGVVHSAFALPHAVRIQHDDAYNVGSYKTCKIWNLSLLSLVWAQERGVPLRIDKDEKGKFFIERLVDEEKVFVDSVDDKTLAKQLRISDARVSAAGVNPNVICTHCLGEFDGEMLRLAENYKGQCANCTRWIEESDEGAFISLKLSIQSEERRNSLRSSVKSQEEVCVRSVFEEAVQKLIPARAVKRKYTLSNPEVGEKLKIRLQSCPYECQSGTELMEYDQRIDQFTVTRKKMRLYVCTKCSCYKAYKGRKRFCNKHSPVD